MFEIRVIFIFCIGLLTFFNFVSSKNDGWLLWTQWSECPDLICSGERYKPLIRRSRECRNTVFGEDVCGDETIEVEEKNCRPNIPECTHEWTLWTNVSPSSMTQTTIRKYRYTGYIFSGRNARYHVSRRIYQRAQVETLGLVIATISRISRKAKINIVKA